MFSGRNSYQISHQGLKAISDYLEYERIHDADCWTATEALFLVLNQRSCHQVQPPAGDLFHAQPWAHVQGHFREGLAWTSVRKASHQGDVHPLHGRDTQGGGGVQQRGAPVVGVQTVSDGLMRPLRCRYRPLTRGSDWHSRES
jgi:hypothetical protein